MILETDLVEILKDCPEDTPLYSPVFGEVKLYKVKGHESCLPIEVIITENSGDEFIRGFTAYGRLTNMHDAECMLFPSKDCRDWSQFKAPKFDLEGLISFATERVKSDDIKKVMELIVNYSQFAGEHHKMWVIDQIVRAIMKDNYDNFITAFCDGEEGANTYSWDTGIAP